MRLLHLNKDHYGAMPEMLVVIGWWSLLTLSYHKSNDLIDENKQKILQVVTSKKIKKCNSKFYF